MHPADLTILTLYLLGVLGVGVWFLRRQQRSDEYFVGDRRMGAGHIGLSVVLLIPRVKTLGDRYGWTTYPEFLEHRFDGKTRLVAALVSGLGYAAFVGAQLLAGAKLSAAAFDVNLTTAVWIMAGVVIVYTSFGGLQAVVFTDTIQWAVPLSALVLVGGSLARPARA